MFRTYEAVIKGNLIEWQGEIPPLKEETRVQVTIEEPPLISKEERKRALLAALDGLAASGAFSEIKDPVAWQREIRKDRPLPGRED
jgi:hypothetical protein